MKFTNSIHELRPLLEDADHLDVKTVEGKVSMREFVTGMLCYYPGWYKCLYKIRGIFAKVLKLEHAKSYPTIAPSELPMSPGGQALFLQVKMAEEERYWVGEVNDRHLYAALIVAVEPLDTGKNRFHVMTVVRYNNRIGPVYFNLIRPFHHLVVSRMAKAGANNTNKENDQ